MENTDNFLSHSEVKLRVVRFSAHDNSLAVRIAEQEAYLVCPGFRVPGSVCLSELLFLAFQSGNNGF